MMQAKSTCGAPQVLFLRDQQIAHARQRFGCAGRFGRNGVGVGQALRRNAVSLAYAPKRFTNGRIADLHIHSFRFLRGRKARLP